MDIFSRNWCVELFQIYQTYNCSLGKMSYLSPHTTYKKQTAAEGQTSLELHTYVLNLIRFIIHIQSTAKLSILLLPRIFTTFLTAFESPLHGGHN